MFQRILLILTQATLVMALLLWTTSAFRYDDFTYSKALQDGSTCTIVNIESSRGSLIITVCTYRWTPPTTGSVTKANTGVWQHLNRREFGGEDDVPRWPKVFYQASNITIGNQFPAIRQNAYLVNLPYWLVTLVSALFPLMKLLRRILKRAALPQQGLCPKCGYDVRASTDRCPECGGEIHRMNSVLHQET